MAYSLHTTVASVGYTFRTQAPGSPAEHPLIDSVVRIDPLTRKSFRIPPVRKVLAILWQVVKQAAHIGGDVIKLLLDGLGVLDEHWSVCLATYVAISFRTTAPHVDGDGPAQYIKA